MRYHEEDIRFAIKILSCRKELENREVERWMSVPEHVELLKELVAIRQKSSIVDFEQDKSAVYFHLRQTISQRKRRHVVLYRSIAVAVLFLIGGVSTFWVTDNLQKASNEKSTIQAVSFRPGNVAIELTLADGQTVKLSRTGGVNGNLLKAGIRNDSLHGLSYADAIVDLNNTPVYNTLNVPKGGFYPVELSDGTKVWLNSETKLRYPIKFTEGQRKVYLKGEAYFDVVRDERHPFIVQVDEMEVMVLGTRFNVNSYNRDTIRTTLVDGSVSIKHSLTNKEVMLCPNEMAKFCKRTGSVVKTKVDPFIYTAWKDDQFVFENETIEEIMERLGRWYNITVFYENQAVKMQTFTGIIERFADVRDILYLIEETATVKFSIKDQVIVVK